MLPFSPQVYLRLLESYNAAIWPAQIIALGLGGLVLFLIARPRRGSDRWVAALLAGAWLWTGTVCHMLTLAPLNWAAWVSGTLFVVQSAMLAWTGSVRGSLAFRWTPAWRGRVGLALAGLALLAAPLAGAMTDLGWTRAPVAGVASGPTTLFTLGVLLLADGRVPPRLLVIPVLWSWVAAVTAWPLGVPQDLFLPLAAMASVWLALAGNRKLGKNAGKSM